MVNDEMYVYLYNAESVRRSPNIEKRKKYAGDTIRIAALHKEFFTKVCDDKELCGYFIKHINSRIASAIYLHIKSKSDNSILEEVYKIAKENGLYPIKGNTLSWKWDLLKPVLNNKRFWFLLELL